MSAYLPHLRKLRKAKRAKQSDIENEVAKALYDLEMNHKTLRSHLPRFHINCVKEVEQKGIQKKGLICFYPLRYIMLVRKTQKLLIAELEKRFPGRIVCFIAQRKITKRPKDVYALQKVQRSRTQTAVNDGILADLLHPADVVGRRIKFNTDGSRMQKVYLDSRDKKKTDARLAMISCVYKKLTHRPVTFGFMWNPRLQQIAHR